MGAFPEIVQETQGGAIFEPNTSGALAAKLAEILGNTEKLSEFSKNGRNSIINKYNTDITTKQMLGIYESVIANRK